MVVTGESLIILSSNSLSFYKRNDGTHTPDVITVQADLVNADGPITLTVQGATGSNVTDKTVDIAFSSVTGNSVVVTAQAANHGAPFSRSIVIGVVTDGAAGTSSQGARGAGHWYVTGSSWSDIAAQAACPGGPVTGDVVTISNGTTFVMEKTYNGSSWNVLGVVIDGGAIIPGSVTANQINSNGLSIRDTNGNVILSAGVPLQPQNFAGTLGGDNLLNNSGFEVYDSITNRPSGYTVYNNNSTASASFLNIAGRTGGRAFGVRANASSNTTFGLHSSNDIIDGTVVGGVQGGWQPNKTYVISFKAKKVNLAGAQPMMLQWNTPPASVVFTSRPTLSTTWQTYTARIVWGASVEGSGRLFIDSIGSGTGSVVAGDEFHVDELIIQEGDVYSEWFQSSREAKATADAAISALTVIADDHKLSVGEKPAVEKEWAAIYNESASLISQADALGVSRVNYVAKLNALNSYLGNIPGWGDRVTDSPIDPTTFTNNFTAYYTEKTTLVNAIAQQASTMANWGSVAGRPSHCRVVAAGGNASGYNIGPGFYIESTSSATYGAGRSYNLVVIRRSDRAIINHDVFDVYGNITEAYRLRNVLNGYGADVIIVVYTADEPLNNHFESTLAAAMYRCGASKAVYGSPQFQYRSAYILVGIPGVGEGGGAEAYQGNVGNDPNAWCDIGLTIDNLGNFQVSANFTPRSLADYGYTGDLNATIGAPSGTYVGGMEAGLAASYAANGNSAYNAVNDATHGLEQRLRANAQNILANGGGLSTGNLAWDSNGNRVSGYGIAINQQGIVAFNSSGAATFTLNGATGAATYGGALSAVTGTFGAVTVAAGGSISSGQTAYNTGVGFFFGFNGTTPVFSVGTGGGSGIRWDGTTLTIQSPVIASSFSATITSSSSSYTVSRTATNGYGGSYTANPANGTGPYAYSWTVSTSGISRGWIGGSSTGQQAQLSIEANGRVNGDEQDFYMTCVVTDTASNISKTITYLTVIYFS
jgi:hypothetical protein